MTLKLVFMGTPDFAVPALTELIKKYEVAAIFTQPDKPKGRGQKIQFTPVKELALKNNIEVYQPNKLRNNEECLKLLEAIKPDLIIVIAFGQILPPEILKIPRLGCVNLHASLLPKLRGAAPINWAIINGEKVTGNTTMLMAEGLDTGDMLLKTELAIGDEETAGQLHDRLAEAGTELLIKTIEGLNNSSIVPEKQQDELSNYAPMMNKELGRIDWSRDCVSIDRLVRGVTPWPGAFSNYNGKIIKLLRVVKCEKKNYEEAGVIVGVNREGIEVSCGTGSLVIIELQEVGGKRMDITAYLNGHKVNLGDKFE